MTDPSGEGGSALSTARKVAYVLMIVAAMLLATIAGALADTLPQ